MALMSNRTWDDWISEYAESHQHPTNRLCHTIGIPMIAVSGFFFAAGIVVPRVLVVAAGLFVVGWIFQFIGHAYEKKPPEFFKDWRFFFFRVRGVVPQKGGGGLN